MHSALHTLLTIAWQLMGYTEGVGPVVARPEVALLSVPQSGIRLERTVESATIRKPMSLCGLLSHTALAGYYQVEDLTGSIEVDITDGEKREFTYVTLKRISAWSENAPDKVVARMLGGPGAKPGTSTSSQVSLAVGEQIGYLGFYLPENSGYPGIDSQWVFKKGEKGGLTNHELFTLVPWSVDELGQVVWWDMQSKGGCPLDAMPDQQEAL